MGYFQPPQRKWLTDFLKNLYSGKTEKPPIPENKEGYTWRKHQWLDELDKLPLLERSIVAHSIFVRPNALQAAPSISTRILLELEIAPDAAEGACRIRLVSGRNISNEKIFHFPLESLVGEIGILIQTIGSIVILRNIRHIGRFGTYILVNGHLSSFHRKIPMSKAI
jgi:hypothetical protein